MSWGGSRWWVWCSLQWLCEVVVAEEGLGHIRPKVEVCEG